ncbi:hypothetical protein ACOMHN_058269 [Nucella lapillus]
MPAMSSQKMRAFLLLSVLLTAARAATVVAPVTADATDIDTTSVAPPDLLTGNPSMVPSGTPAASKPTDTPVPVTDTSVPVNFAPGTSASVTDTSAPDVTTGASSNITKAPVVVMTTTSLPCQPAMAQIKAMINYSNTGDFTNLSENQQILVYELLAAGEACRLKDFITPETAQRIFLLAEDLPLKNVYLLISFMARNMESEGVVVPV